MKKYWFVLALAAGLAACADYIPSDGTSNLLITLNTGEARSRGIIVEEYRVIRAEIGLEGPSNFSTNGVWTPGGETNFLYTGLYTGEYTIGLLQIDESGATNTESQAFDVHVGSNYRVVLTLGGIIDIGVDGSTNTNG